jgi:TIR domain
VPGIFISYRREDAPGHAGRIYDEMTRRFGVDPVFMDLDIEPGVDFVEQINDAVGSCRVLITVIGPRWIGIEDAHGERRIDDPGDFIRLEVEAALARSEVRVIPVLVQRARMPTAAELPASLAELARRNALELSDGRWSYDVGRLTSTVERVLGTAVAPTPGAGPPAATAAKRGSGGGRLERARAREPAAGGEPETARGSGWFSRHLVLAAAVLAVVVAAVIGIVLATGSSQSSGALYSDDAGHVSPAGIEVSNLEASADDTPPKLGEDIQVAFSFKNVGSRPVTFAETFVGARDPNGGNKDFANENQGVVLKPGEALDVNRTRALDAGGTWEFWPCYTLRTGSPKPCPDEWRSFQVSVAR